MTIETQTNNRRSRGEAFRDKVASLEYPPLGFEYKKFFGMPVLFPGTGGDPIRKGTGYTERQLEMAIQLAKVRMQYGSSMFERFIHGRDDNIRTDACDFI